MCHFSFYAVYCHGIIFDFDVWYWRRRLKNKWDIARLFSCSLSSHSCKARSIKSLGTVFWCWLTERLPESWEDRGGRDRKGGAGGECKVVSHNSTAKSPFSLRSVDGPPSGPAQGNKYTLLICYKYKGGWVRPPWRKGSILLLLLCLYIQSTEKTPDPVAE